ncbi:MAG TPA: FAD-dependent oxidoreductase [Rhodothermales bacterium]|nr:FAD-dependent oxidoreductase [Rhodothermales bacterium]
MVYDFDMIVLGGGAAGLTAAGISASFGAKTLIIERHKLGGDCTWTGCVPSKTLLKAAKVAHQMRHASHYGLTDQDPDFDFGAMMDHLRSVRQEVYKDADAPSIFEEMGVEVRHGEAQFLDEHTLALDSEKETIQITGRYFIIAAGARPSVPPIDGLADVPYLTSETLFEITEQPRHLAIIGGGPIGTEMAQAFRRFGTRVTVIDQAEGILQKDDPELTEMLQQVLVDEGIAYVFKANVQKVTHSDGQMAIQVKQDGQQQTIEADTLLLATGRRPNLDTLDLDAAGVAYTANGITINDHCRTNQQHIYAVGDVTGRYQFTHMSEHMAKVAASNALYKLPLKIDTKQVPWCTYTDPELAHVGAREKELQDNGTSYHTYRFPYTKVDRAITEGETTGLIKVFAKKWSGKILGATILGAGAGDLICEYAVAMKNGVTLREIADTIHPYPSYGLAARRAADQWYVQKQSTTLVRMMQKLFGYRGPVIEPDPNRVV